MTFTSYISVQFNGYEAVLIEVCTGFFADLDFFLFSLNALQI